MSTGPGISVRDKKTLSHTGKPGSQIASRVFLCQNFFKTINNKIMLTIQHQKKQFEFHVRFSTEWLYAAGRVIAAMFDFSDVRAVQKQKEQMLQDFDQDYLKMN
jgi:hypothetical protein